MEASWMSLSILLSFLERQGNLSDPELCFLKFVKELAEKRNSFKVFKRPSGYHSALIDLETLVQAVLEFAWAGGEHPAFSLGRKGFFGTFPGGLEIAPYSVWEAIFGEIEREMDKRVS